MNGELFNGEIFTLTPDDFSSTTFFKTDILMVVKLSMVKNGMKVLKSSLNMSTVYLGNGNFWIVG